MCVENVKNFTPKVNNSFFGFVPVSFLQSFQRFGHFSKGYRQRFKEISWQAIFRNLGTKRTFPRNLSAFLSLNSWRCLQPNSPNFLFSLSTNSRRFRNTQQELSQEPLIVSISRFPKMFLKKINKKTLRLNQVYRKMLEPSLPKLVTIFFYLELSVFETISTFCLLLKGGYLQRFRESSRQDIFRNLGTKRTVPRELFVLLVSKFLKIPSPELELFVLHVNKF